MIYLEILTKFGVRPQDLKPYKDQILLIFNDSSTHSCGKIHLPITLEERDRRRTVEVFFFMIPYKGVYNDILGRPLMATLDTISYPFLFKFKYDDESSKPVMN